MKKMIMAVIPQNEAEYVLNALINAGFTATFTETKGGILRQSQFSLFIAIPDENVQQVLEIIRENCRPKIDEVSDNEQFFTRQEASFTGSSGGTVVFVWDLNHMEIY